MIPVDAGLLRRLAPVRFQQRIRQNKIVDVIGPLMSATLDKYDINTRQRVACFLGQICYESDMFTATEEYASGKAYEGRADLGNTHPGDGVRYKGRGLIEITGLKNYTRMEMALGLNLVNRPDLASEPATSLLIACQYWKDYNINYAADRGDIANVTHLVQGGSRGLKERAAFTSTAKLLLAQSQGQLLADTHGETIDRRVLYRGVDDMDGVLTLQRALRVPDEAPHLSIDGDFGAATEMAVMDFQEAHNLEIDGIVGPQTWAALLDNREEKTP